ncbi:MAG: beta-propeller fold lactonase family protein, partial [Verrucomicrobiota bacterium]
LSPRDAEPPPNTGPRHIGYHPTLPIVYFSNEQRLGLSVYRQSSSGSLELLQIADAVDENFDQEGTSSSDIVISQDGTHAFVGIRGHRKDFDRIARFALDAGTGKASFLGLTKADPIPWGMALSPQGDYLLVTAANGATLACYLISDQGDLSLAGKLAWDEKITDVETR